MRFCDKVIVDGEIRYSCPTSQPFRQIDGLWRNSQVIGSITQLVYCDIRGESKLGWEKICDTLLRNMKLSNFPLAASACLGYLVLLAKATNVSTFYNSAAQDATAFAIQVHEA